MKKILIALLIFVNLFALGVLFLMVYHLGTDGKYWLNEYRHAKCEYAEAMRLAEEAKSAGEYDMACNYVVNAIAHRRNGLQCFNLYFNIIKSAENYSAEWKQKHFDRLEKYIVSAVVGGDAGEIIDLLPLAGVVRRDNEAIIEQMIGEEEPEPIVKKEEIALDKMIEIVRCISVLRNKMEGDPVNKDLYAGMIRKDYQRIDLLYSALIGEDNEGMDTNVVVGCGKLYQEVKQELVAFEQYLSKPYYDAICNEVKKIKGECCSVVINKEADGHITKKMKEVNRRVADVRTKILKITDEAMTQKVTDLIGGDMANCLDELSRKRMESYQQYAIEQIKSAAKCYDDKGSKWDDDKKDEAMGEAWKSLKNVSPGLLVPEVSEFYSSVWNKVFDAYANGQKGPQDGMENDKKCKFSLPTRWKILRAKERGKQLEDF